MQLPVDIRDQIQECPDATPDTHLRWVPDVERAFARSFLHGQWSGFIDHINDTCIYALEVCHLILSGYRPDAEVDEETLSNILDDVISLISDVTTSNIPTSVRDFMIDHLMQIDQAIQEFRISGASPLKEAVESAYFEIVRDPSLYKHTSDTKSGKKFWAIIFRVAAIFSIVANLPALDEYSDSFFLDSAPVEDAETVPARGILSRTTNNEDEDLGSDKGA